MTKDDIIPSRTDVLSMAREADREWDCDRDMVEWLEWFAALVAAAAIKDAPDYKMGYADGVAAEREAIMDEWWMCVQSDLENGVKSLNERAAEKWRKEYPEMARFGDVVRGRDKE